MTGGTPTSTVAEYYEGGTVPWLVSGDIHGFEIFDCEKRITPKAVENSNARVLPKDSVLIALNGQGKTRGTVALLRMQGARVTNEIHAHSVPVVERCYRRFLLESSDPDSREYPDESDQIREVLVHGHYMSQRDLETCSAFDLTGCAEIREHPGFSSMLALHKTLVQAYTLVE